MVCWGAEHARRKLVIKCSVDAFRRLLCGGGREQFVKLLHSFDGDVQMKM